MEGIINNNKLSYSSSVKLPEDYRPVSKSKKEQPYRTKAYTILNPYEV